MNRVIKSIYMLYFPIFIILVINFLFSYFMKESEIIISNVIDKLIKNMISEGFTNILKKFIRYVGLKIQIAIKANPINISIVFVIKLLTENLFIFS